MSGTTITHESVSALEPVSGNPGASVGQSRAAKELGLKRREFELAVGLGHIRTLADDGGGGCRVERAEIERLRAQEGFPQALRDRVEAVGTRQAAQIMRMTTVRFTRLARLGLLVPVAFYLNRYRAVVWLYLADELRQFAADEKNTSLLTRPLAETLRDQLDAGVDLRPRNWRGRHLGFLLRQAADDPWAQAAAPASLLDPLQISEIVPDPYERAHLNRHRTRPQPHGAPGSPAADLVEHLSTAQDADEIAWLRADLAQSMREARAHRPAPRPAPHHADPASHHLVPGPASGRRPVGDRRRASDRRPALDSRRHAPERRRPPEPARKRSGHHPGQRPARCSHGLLGRLFRRGA
ncbi:DUF6397 family protein [Streptomyces sp. NPDC057197]|uniref:DUF6397 family protein n=1 Tax=unclassified Streptomyces TaxID=2593676 RepID=UPI0007DE0B1C|nr:DUF6397 family protein [Streptomyces sp. SAT1]ANH90384.1 hypothetical protein A8713_03845 [Streptomyces sp. SAT1]